MRVLLDEQLPRQLVPYFVDHEVRTVQQEGWAGLKNGALLNKAEGSGFAVLVTGDKNMPFQQNIAKRKLAVLVMVAPSNAIEDLLPVVPNALAALSTIKAGQVVRVEA